MQFQSITFLMFFFGVCLLFYIIPGRLRKYWLLLVSCMFYLSLSTKFAFYLAGVILLSYCLGLVLEKSIQYTARRKGLIMAALIATFSALIVVKYSNFFLSNINRILKLFGVHTVFAMPKILQPVGLSFFTFAAAGYLIDVYRGTRSSEKNIVAYALFLSFFPTILSGPIERSTNFLRQIDECHLIRLDTHTVRHGLLTMLYGYFLKIMLADRLNIFVNEVFAKYESYGGLVLCLAVAAFGIQLYCDFAGISSIALGAGEVLGFSLIQNFETPYFSTSIAEFWRRWHISLSTWFRDYLYIPLGGNRKGKIRKYINIMIVFLVSGVWHGSGWSFIVWGGLHGAYQIIGDLLRPVRQKICKACDINTENIGNRFMRMSFVFLLVNFAWLFFRAESLTHALRMILQAFSNWAPWQLFDGTLLKLGLDYPDIIILLCSIVVMLAASLLQYHKVDWKNKLMEQGFVFRATVYIFCIVILIVFGIYGPSYSASSFIYVDF